MLGIHLTAFSENNLLIFFENGNLLPASLFDNDIYVGCSRNTRKGTIETLPLQLA